VVARRLFASVMPNKKKSTPAKKTVATVASPKPKATKSAVKEVEKKKATRTSKKTKVDAVAEDNDAEEEQVVVENSASSGGKLVRQKSDPSLRVVAKGVKSTAPDAPDSQDDYATPYGAVKGSAKVMSWNLNGINAWLNNGGLAVLEKDAPDVVCLQEVKANEPDVASWTKKLGNWPHVYFSCCSTQKGYAGTAVLSRHKPVSVHYGLDDSDAHEPEGRVIFVEFAGFILVNTYVPNSGMKLENLVFREQWDAKLLQRMLALSKKLGNKPLLWTGDLNVAHTDYDLAKPDERRNKVPGACDEERAGLDKAIAAGFVDVWRKQHATDQHFTFWTYKFQAREKNIGWRLDYWLATGGLDAKLGDTFIRSKAVGSDHVPIGVLVPPSLL
jgi:exodeoxyribonuclease III